MEREASVKLTLNNSQFIVSVKRAGDEVQETGKKVSNAGKAWSAGITGAKTALGGLASKTKEVLGMAGGLAAAFSLGTAVQQSLHLREKFRDLEFQINKTGKTVDGQAADWESLMGAARDAGRETGQSLASMEEAAHKLFSATGDADYSIGALEAIGHAAQATGDSVDDMANVAQMLQRKFGATLETLPDMMAVFVEKTDAGGLSLGALGDKFALMAGEAQEAGFKGKEGLSSLLGIMTQLDSRIGEKSEPAMKKLFQLFKEGSKDLKALSKESGIKFADNETGVEKFRKMLGSEKGRATLQAKLGGEARVVYDELAKPFEEAFDQAKKSGAKTKDATQAGLEAWDRSMKEMSKSTIDYQRLIQESKGGQEEDPAKRLEMAMEDFTEAIATPELFDAIDSLAANLPALAEALAKVVHFIVKNPWLAGGLAVGGSVGGGFVKGAGEKLLGKAGSATGKALEKASDRAGQIFADTAGKYLAANPGMALAGKALGAAAAAFIGYEIGKQLVDLRMESKEKNQGDLRSADIEAFNAMNSGDKGQMRDARAKLKEKIAQMEEDQGGVGGAVDKLMGGIATIMPGGDPNFVAPEQKQLMNAKRQLRDLERRMNEGEKADQPGAPPPNGGAAHPGEKRVAAAHAGPLRQQRVKIDDVDELARQNARALQGITLRVKVEDQKGLDGSRGPLVPPAPGT